jgi:hypothetical protein
MIAVVVTVGGTFGVDLETDEVLPSADRPERVAQPVLNLPRLVAAAASGSTVIAVIDTKPPLAISHDAGITWRESGRGLPPGRAVAISDDDPDVAVYAARNRLFVTRDGGMFWTALAVELPEIVALALRD